MRILKKVCTKTETLKACSAHLFDGASHPGKQIMTFILISILKSVQALFRLQHVNSPEVSWWGGAVNVFLSDIQGSFSLKERKFYSELTAVTHNDEGYAFCMHGDCSSLNQR